MRRSTRRLPKLNISKYLTSSALSNVAGKSGVYAQHTDGEKCDTTKGCNC